MSEGQIGVTVSTANPFDDSSTYYNNEPSTDNNNAYLNTYQYPQNDSTCTNNFNCNYNYTNQHESYMNNSNNIHDMKPSFAEKTKNGVDNVLQKTSDKVGKPFIRFGQKINSKFIQLFKF